MKITYGVFVVLLGLCFLLVACSSNTTTPVTTAPKTTAPVSSAATTTSAAAVTTATTSPAASTVTPQYGGTVMMWINSDPVSLWPPSMTGQSDGQTAGLGLEPLFYLDKQSNLVPLLATDWKSDATAKTITLTLRKGVKFQDGSDFNATVCKWNLDQYRTSSRAELKKVS